jgi:hypothetical protein
MVSGHDARHRCRTGLFLQSLSIPQVLSPREDLFCLSLHSGSKLKGSLMRDKDMGSQVHFPLQAFQKG